MMRIYTIGETLLDIIFKGADPQTAKPGGAAFNTSITLGRLGAPINFISEIGNDRVGDLIQDFMEDNGVKSRYISRYPDGQSTIALAFLDEKSDAEYQFYKDYPARRLAVDYPDFQKDDLFLFGSFAALNPDIRPRVMEFVKKAHRAGTTILYDPNFRSTHLQEKEQMLPLIKENMGYATLVRASNEDLVNLFGTESPNQAWEKVSSFTGALVYTASAEGVYLRTSKLSLHMEVERIEPVSTIGAGDTFNAGLLYGLWKKGFRQDQIGTLDQGQWEELISVAIQFSREVCLSYDNYLPTNFARHFTQKHL
jgi:fructokinase